MRGRILQTLALFLLGAVVSPVIVLSQEPLELEKVVERMLASKMYHPHGKSESVTMSPDRELAKEFKNLGEPGLKKLREFLNHDQRDVRHHACLILADLPTGNDALLVALKDEDCRSRENILQMLGGAIRDHRFIEAAGELIDDPDKSLSLIAIGVTGRTHYLKVANDLVQMTQGKDEERALAAAYALCSMGIPQGATKVVQNAREIAETPFEHSKIIDVLGASGSVEAVDYLLEMFDKGAAMTDGDDQPSGMIFSAEEHQEMMTGKNPKGAGIMLTGRTAGALARINARRPMPKVQKALEHPNEHVRNAALRALSAGDPTAGKSLLRYLKTAPQEAKSYILFALSKTKNANLIPELQGLDDGDQPPALVAALAALGDASVLDEAIKMLNSSDVQQQQFGVIAVSKLAKKSQPALEAATKFLDQAENSDDMFQWLGTHVKHAKIEEVLLEKIKKVEMPTQDMMRALASVGGPETIAWFKEQQSSKDAGVRYGAACCLNLLTGQQQTFIRDSGEEVIVVLTAKYEQIRLQRQESETSEE